MLEQLESIMKIGLGGLIVLMIVLFLVYFLPLRVAS